MTNDSARIFKLENQLRTAQQQIQALQLQVSQLLQNQAASAGTQAGFQGGGGGGGLVAWGGSGVSPASEPPADGGGGLGFSTSYQIYQIVNGGYRLVNSSATIYNPMPNSIPDGYVLEVTQNPDGTYTVSALACQTF